MSIHLGVIILVLQLKKKKKDSERINNIYKVTMSVHRAKVHTLTSSDWKVSTVLKYYASEGAMMYSDLFVTYIT